MSVSLSSSTAVVARLSEARDIAFGAYLLADGAMRRALIDAARRGAHVTVTLQADPYRNEGGARCNAGAARELRAAGAEVQLVPSATTAFHLKALVADGVAYLDDRNWPRDRGVVVQDDDARDVALVRDALRGHGGDDGTLATRKDAALREAQALIDAAPDAAPVVVATESFGSGPVSAAIRRRAARGAPVTLLVDERRLTPRARALVDGLAQLGVRVRNSDADEKFVLAGDAGWIGSANATESYAERGDQIEWSLVTRDSALLGALRRLASG